MKSSTVRSEPVPFVFIKKDSSEPFPNSSVLDDLISKTTNDDLEILSK